MINPILPTIEHILENFDTWKKYTADLNTVMKSAIEQNKIMQNNKSALYTIKDLFDRYVSTRFPDKIFDPDKIQVHGSNHYKYLFDFVSISYHGRHTWVIDDYDYFTDTIITVNGICIANQLKQ